MDAGTSGKSTITVAMFVNSGQVLLVAGRKTDLHDTVNRNITTLTSQPPRKQALTAPGQHYDARDLCDALTMPETFKTREHP